MKMTPIFILIFGPPAVGKLSVARALARRTGFGLTHNHVAIEAALPLFKFGTDEFRALVSNLRREIYSAAASSKLPGMIGTFVWNFSSSNSREMVERWCTIFREHGWRIVFVELRAELETRLERNQAPGRTVGKASKLDPDVSRSILLANERDWIMAPPDDYVMVPPADLWLSLDTNDMTPEIVADHIIRDADLANRQV